MDYRLTYQTRIPVLKQVAEEIQILLKELFENTPRIDKIATRVKEISSFVQKANKVDKEGSPKYRYPLEEIQDQIGARIVVYYRSDVDPIAKRILSEFRQVEDRKLEAPEPESFGYEARHFVCFIPQDICVKYQPPIDFFELQVSTLFQHAWAQANHDLGYKSRLELSYDEQRRIAWAAAQAWGADLIFDELWSNGKIYPKRIK